MLSFCLSIFCAWFQLSVRCFHIKSIKEIVEVTLVQCKKCCPEEVIHFHSHLYSAADFLWADEGTPLPGHHSSRPWSEWWSYIISEVPLGFEITVKGLWGHGSCPVNLFTRTDGLPDGCQASCLTLGLTPSSKNTEMRGRSVRRQLSRRPSHIVFTHGIPQKHQGGGLLWGFVRDFLEELSHKDEQELAIQTRRRHRKAFQERESVYKGRKVSMGCWVSMVGEGEARITKVLNSLLRSLDYKLGWREPWRFLTLRSSYDQRFRNPRGNRKMDWREQAPKSL